MANDPTPRGQPPDEVDDVVEFGPVDPEGPRPHRSPLSVATAAPVRVIRAVWGDRRLVPVVAVLAALALFASLVGEWQVITLEGVDLPAALRPLTAGVAVLDAFGAAYLLAVFALAACAALVFRGAPAVRRHARLIGLALTAALGGLLIAVSIQLDRLGPAYGYLTVGWEIPPAVSAGRGLEAAFAGVGLAALALYLAGRPAWTGVEPLAADPAAADPARHATHDGWRRPRGATDTDEVAAPLDLSVGPAAPFAQLPDDRA
jgi:hypothetical protein